MTSGGQRTAAERKARQRAKAREAGRRELSLILSAESLDWLDARADRLDVSRSEALESALRGLRNGLDHTSIS